MVGKNLPISNRRIGKIFLLSLAIFCKYTSSTLKKYFLGI